MQTSNNAPEYVIYNKRIIDYNYRPKTGDRGNIWWNGEDKK